MLFTNVGLHLGNDIPVDSTVIELLTQKQATNR